MLPNVLRDGITNMWHNQGIKKIGLYENNILMSFVQLCRAFHLPTTHFFKYLQVRHFMYISGSKLPSPKAPPNWWDSKRYQTPQRHLAFTEIKPLNTRTKWEQDLDCTFEDSEWESRCEEALSLSYNSHHLQFNVIHRTCFMPERHHRINESISDMCPRCKTETCNLIHVTWKCNKLKRLWGAILEILKEIIVFEIPCSPKYTYLTSLLPRETRCGLSKRNLSRKWHQKKLCSISKGSHISLINAALVLGATWEIFHGLLWIDDEILYVWHIDMCMNFYVLVSVNVMLISPNVPPEPSFLLFSFFFPSDTIAFIIALVWQWGWGWTDLVG